MRRAALLLNPTLFSFNRIAGGADRPRPAGACVASAGRSHMCAADHGCVGAARMNGGVTYPGAATGNLHGL